VAVVIGWGQGFLRPVLTEAAFILALVAVAAARGPLLDVLAPRLSLPAELILVVSVMALTAVLAIPVGGLATGLRRMHLAGADRGLGVALQVALAVVGIYLVVATLAGAERAVRPLPASPASPVSEVQVQAFGAAARRDPLLSSLVRPEQLREDRTAAGRGQLTLGQLEERHPWVRLYRERLRSLLLGSRLAPDVLRYGDRLPGVGRAGLALP